jgi:hypothetical protein
VALAVCLIFLSDGASTMLGLAAGGRETNPFVAGLSPPAYALSCLLRAAIACALLAVTARARRAIRHPTQVACLGLVGVKSLATVSNLAFAWREMSP